MIEQIGNALPFNFFFSTAGLGTTGLTVTGDIYKNGVLLLAGQAVAEVGGGLYSYTLAALSVDVEGVYIVIGKTATVTVDQREMAAAWYVGKAGVENLNALMSMTQTLGRGSVSITITVSDGSHPLDGVDMWITTDSAGNNLVARCSTNALGQATYLLDVGVYYAWAQLAGYEFTNPTIITVI